MKRVSALELRQSMGAVLKDLERTGEPVILEKAHKPIGVIISIRDFNERFIDKAAAQERERLFEEMDATRTRPVIHASTVDLVREMRGYDE